MVPDTRVVVRHDVPPRRDGDYVLYWLIGARRTRFHPGLERAAQLCRELNKPLFVLEPLRAGYPYASDRLHRYVIDGMESNEAAFTARDIAYYPYVEPEPGAGKGLLAAAASRACAVITDAFPHFFLPRMVDTAAKQVPCRFEQVDGNGLLPLARTERVFPSAALFRRYLHPLWPELLAEAPVEDPLAGLPNKRAPIPRELSTRWPRARFPVDLAALPIDHTVTPVAERGGEAAARERLRAFVRKLSAYAEDRNAPDRDATSRLSAYLHFGHLSIHEVIAAVIEREGWSPAKIDKKAAGRREGFFRMSPEAEGFLDEAVTWRELGYNMAAHRPGYTEFDSLPSWAVESLEKHGQDARPHLYTLEQLERGETADELWNASQRQLVRDGRIHNYLRMLWGKKILEWSPSPREALRRMLYLNDKWAIDGRDPNSVSGIFWVLGRYDRPWGPERPIFGVIRYMTSQSTMRKLPVKDYLARYAPEGSRVRQYGLPGLQLD